MNSNTIIKKLILFLFFLTIVFWLLKPNPPFEQTRGAVVKMIEVHDLQLPINPFTLGIKGISINLDNKRINRVNQRRDLKLIKEYPNVFGQDGVFKPLITLTAQGPINIQIKGDGPTKTILFHVPEGLFEAHIYPEYETKELFHGKAGEKETITITQWKPRGRALHVDTILAQWSGPNDLFLSTKNLTDLASLTKEYSSKTKVIPANTIEELYSKLGKNIKESQIRYETDLPYQDGDERGWQLIRDPQEIEKQKKANCIDIAILTCIQSHANGFIPYIWANSGHALCASSYKDQSPEEAIPFEGTDFLKPPLKPPTNPQESPREYLPNEEIIYPERQPPTGDEPPLEKIFSMDYTFWKKFYKDSPKNDIQ